MDELEQPGAGPDSGDAARPAAGQDDSAVDQHDAGNVFDDPDANDGEQGDAEPELGELEVDGKKFALPKDVAERLKSERMMQADYTRKTQETAAKGRELEARAQQLEQREKDQQQLIAEHAKVVAIDDQLRQYAALDWNAFADSDPVGALKAQQQMRALETMRAQAVDAVTQKQQQFALTRQQEIAKQVQEANDYFAREIPGWNADLDNQVNQYVTSQGISQQAIAEMALRTPAVAKLAHKAMLYDRLVQAQQKAKQQAQPKAEPVPRLGTNSRATKDPSKMTDKEFAAWRRAQIAQRK